MSGSPTVAVVGATGQQGGAVVRALLAAGARVRGLTRNPSSDSAAALADRGVEVVRGDAGDPDSLRAAFAGAAVAYVMTTPFEGGAERETAEGVAFVDAVRDAGVPRLVLGSVGGAERRTGIPHFESKRRVEEHVGELGLPATFLRPTYFMENLSTNTPPAVEDGTLVLRMPLPAGVPLQMVAVRDIGTAAAALLLDPEAVPGGAVELVGDEVTGEQAAAALGRARGLPARYEAVPLDGLDDDMRAMFTWFTHLPAYRGDPAASRRLVPDLHDLPAWLAEQG